MKKLIATTIFLLFLVCCLKAQTEVKLHSFSTTTAVVRVLESTSVAMLKPTISIADGNSELAIDIEKVSPKFNMDIAKLIVSITNQLSDQGYKLVGTNSGGVEYDVAMMYIFRKD